MECKGRRDRWSVRGEEIGGVKGRRDRWSVNGEKRQVECKWGEETGGV